MSAAGDRDPAGRPRVLGAPLHLRPRPPGPTAAGPEGGTAAQQRPAGQTVDRPVHCEAGQGRVQGVLSHSAGGHGGAWGGARAADDALGGEERGGGGWNILLKHDCCLIPYTRRYSPLRGLYF